MNAKGSDRRQLLCEASNSVIEAIVDVVKMVINRRVTMTPTQLRNARRKERSFLRLTNTRTPLASKRRLLVQDGGLLGFIAPLLKLAAPVLGNLLGGVFGGDRRG